MVNIWTSETTLLKLWSKIKPRQNYENRNLPPTQSCLDKSSAIEHPSTPTKMQHRLVPRATTQILNHLRLESWMKMHTVKQQKSRIWSTVMYIKATCERRLKKKIDKNHMKPHKVQIPCSMPIHQTPCTCWNQQHSLSAKMPSIKQQASDLTTDFCAKRWKN